MLAIIALLVLAAPPSAPCPCGPNAACADARCESHGGNGACMCRYPVPKFAASTAVSAYASVPTPKFKVESAAKELHPECECESCQCAACDGGCSVSAKAVNGQWVVAISGRRFTVDGAETKESAVRLAKKAAGEVATKATTVGTKTPLVKGHEHKCSSCGTIWAHADNSSNASHNCPKCGRVQMIQHRDVMVPVASKPAPPPKMEPQPFIPLQSYFAPSRSNCPDGQCPQATPTRFGWFR